MSELQSLRRGGPNASRARGSRGEQGGGVPRRRGGGRTLRRRASSGGCVSRLPRGASRSQRFRRSYDLVTSDPLPPPSFQPLFRRRLRCAGDAVASEGEGRAERG